MAKLLLNSAGKVLMGNDKVYKAPNYVDIPQVTNIQLNEQGVLSWNAPDITDLTEYSPTFSYIINVNDYELTSTTNSINLISYLLNETENAITVKVKAVLTHYSNGKQETFEAFSLPTEYVRSLVDISLPVANGTAPISIVGHKAYIFGGFSYSNQNKKSIERIDFEARTCETITASFGDFNLVKYYTERSNSSVAIGTYIYLFGGGGNAASMYTNYIFKFDTETETLTKLETTLLEATTSMLAVASGNYVYLFGGRTADGRINTIFKFDTETETLSTLEATLTISNSYNSLTGQLVGTNIYIFDDLDKKIYKFNVNTETIEVIATTNTLGDYQITSALIGNNIYVFGSKKIFKFDTLTETLTTTSYTTIYARYISTVIYNNKIYLIAGNGINGSKIIEEVCLAG